MMTFSSESAEFELKLPLPIDDVVEEPHPTKVMQTEMATIKRKNLIPKVTKPLPRCETFLP